MLFVMMGKFETHLKCSYPRRLRLTKKLALDISDFFMFSRTLANLVLASSHKTNASGTHKENICLLPLAQFIQIIEADEAAISFK